MRSLSKNTAGPRTPAVPNATRRGAVAVELALVLPLLLLVLFGTTDLGRFSHALVAVSNASRAGASFAGTNSYTTTSRPVWEAGIRQAVRNELETLSGFDAKRLEVKITPQTDAEGRHRVSVQVTYPFETLVNWMALPPTLPLQQTTVFPVLR